MAYTISTHVGHAVAREHNIRDRRITDKEGHIDPHGIHEKWRDETEVHAYHRLFDRAVEDYNARQPRADRKIKNYHADVCKDAKKHPAYEMIIAVGSKENPPDVETAKKIMWEFAASWKKRNPQLELIGAYYHADEQGVPHVHLDFIPVAHGFKRGMETQTSINKALVQMGFASGHMQEWWARENQVLEKICNTFGLEIEHPDAGKGVDHANTEAFKIIQDAKAEASKIVQNAKAEAEKILDGVKDKRELFDAQRDAQKALDKFEKRMTTAASKNEIGTYVSGRFGREGHWELSEKEYKAVKKIVRQVQAINALQADLKSVRGLANVKKIQDELQHAKEELAQTISAMDAQREKYDDVLRTIPPEIKNLYSPELSNDLNTAKIRSALRNQFRKDSRLIPYLDPAEQDRLQRQEKHTPGHDQSH